MTSHTELSRRAIGATAEMVLAHRRPDSRTAIMHGAIGDLSSEDSQKVSGMVISLMCDYLDGLGEEKVLRERIDRAMEGVLLELQVTKGIPGEDS